LHDDTPNKKPSRREARERAFQVLYGLTLVPPDDEAGLEAAFVQAPDPEVEGATGALAAGFAWQLVHGVWTRREELDEIIARFSKHWKVARIARIELTILRLAVYEMLYVDDVPTKVAMNEAIELAKRFGDDNSRSFVNGILDAAGRAREHGEIGTR
jgi:N utilization substance protein B